MRGTCRLTGVAKKTVERLLVSAGEACLKYQDKVMVNLTDPVWQVDEVWSFTYCKQKTKPKHDIDKAGIGDTWTWIAIASKSKLVPVWHIGKRTASDAYWFINDFQKRLANRIQLTSDGLKSYLEAIEGAFGADVDYAQLVKLYGNELTGKDAMPSEVRYSPPVCIGTRKTQISGKPDPKLISTSYVERQNLTIRMANRRFTRLTNAFSKNLDNHKHMMAIHFMHYNFARIHQTLRVTPAMEAGISDHVWSLEEIAGLLD